jgi:hypothetical protein
MEVIHKGRQVTGCGVQGCAQGVCQACKFVI